MSRKGPRNHEAQDKIVAVLEKARAAGAGMPPLPKICEQTGCSKGFCCKVKQWWLAGAEGAVGKYVHGYRGTAKGAGGERPKREPRGLTLRKRAEGPPPTIKVRCLGNAIERPHLLTTTFNLVGGRQIPDSRLCRSCYLAATEAGRFM